MSLDDYLSASEAARQLGVSRQRVATMIRDGDLPAVHPWPRAVRIHRSHVEAWASGERPEAVHRTAARRWVVWEAGVSSINELDEAKVLDLCAQFIAIRRPRWSPEEQRTWAASMTAILLSRS